MISKLLKYENIIIVDMSYFIFYRYYALINWWSFAKKEDKLDKNNLINNVEFVDKFREIFISKLNEIPKKLKLKNFTYIIAKDCPRSSIWRRELFCDYKENRVYEDNCDVGKFFEIGYKILESKLFNIIQHDRLEGDDVAAITTKYILNNSVNSKIYIIANDMDYLQLANEKVEIINLQYKNLKESKNCMGDSKKDLFCKIILGDKSDNIPRIFKKCGLKKALEYYDNPEVFNKQILKEGVMELYERNCTIIDFNNIPKIYVSEFLEKYL